MTIHIEDCTVEIRTRGEFGDKFGMRIKHIPSGAEVEGEYPHNYDHFAARQDLIWRLRKQIKAQVGNTYCHRCEHINPPEAPFCEKCNAGVLTKI